MASSSASTGQRRWRAGDCAFAILLMDSGKLLVPVIVLEAGEEESLVAAPAAVGDECPADLEQAGIYQIANLSPFAIHQITSSSLMPQLRNHLAVSRQ